jgi:hypothetical protein
VPRWPEPSAAPSEFARTAPVEVRDQIERQPVCIGARQWSAGSLGETVLFRSHRSGRRVDVGYFVRWSEERPWGDNLLSYMVLPALATDAFYSHFLYVFPGAKDAIFGPDDIEGVTVEFELTDSGELEVIGGTADDANHTPVRLSRSDLVDSRGRIILVTEAWSHQLGSRGGGRFADTAGNTLRCYENESLRPMTREIAIAFRLGNEEKPLRAGPAWGHPLPVPRNEIVQRQGHPGHG